LKQEQEDGQEKENSFKARTKDGGTTNRAHETPLPPNEEIPEGATRKAWEAQSGPMGPPHTPLDDRHAVGTPGGGTEIGGLAGSNYGEGDAEDVEDPSEAMASGLHEPEAEVPGPQDAYAGNSGGAVGGAPAGKRSRGGRTRRG
jgi:hypothetical protein